jgi:Rieske Fe-S protein
MREGISRKTFIRLGALLGVASAGASVLASCESSSGSESRSGGSNDHSGGGNNEGSSGKQNVNRAERGTSGGRRGASGGRGSASTSGKKTGGKAAKQAPHGQAIARASEVPPGTALMFKDSGGNPAVLVHLRMGSFVAYSAVCTHEGCTVAYRNGQLACPCHGSIFDPAHNARVVHGPARLPLPEIPINVRDGRVVRA